MRTDFTAEQLADPALAECEQVLRKCVHCGFCTATCPTYVLLGDELDGPRGRINLIKDMLETDRPASEEVVTHVDRCLSCLACMTTCPSGVDYRRLVDQARVHIEATFQRPFEERMLRRLIATVLPNRRLFAAALAPARLLRPLLPVLRRIPGLDRFSAMLSLAPSRRPPAGLAVGGVRAGEGFRAGRVVVMQGCAQSVLKPGITRSTVNVLTRLGYEVVLAKGEGCCGALSHHIGRQEDARKAARRIIDLWWREAQRAGLDAIIVTASGCGSAIKDYGHLLRDDRDYAGRAERIAMLATDIHEFLAERGLGTVQSRTGLVAAWHAPCSLQHGQKVISAPRQLLEAAGFEVRDIAEGHLCCGSAGTYNILQPEIAAALLARKVGNIDKVAPDVVATGNIGCITQIQRGTAIPVVHTIELIDWATGGEAPAGLEGLAAAAAHA